jgi:hypothetical protein
MGGIVEHLPDDLAADAQVTAALDLDQGWNRILVDEEVIERKLVSAALLEWDAGLAGEQKPPAGLLLIDLVASEKVRIAT